MGPSGTLFFSRNLDYIYPHAAVTCALFQGTDKFTVLDRRDFNEDLMSNIDGAMNFLKRYIVVRYEMTGEARRREVPELPYDALRVCCEIRRLLSLFIAKKSFLSSTVISRNLEYNDRKVSLKKDGNAMKA